jgi:hypothetical protein
LTAGKDIFLTLEPHLASFTGLSSFSQPENDNPLQFAYKSREEAFDAAAKALWDILEK